jgi:hypothetical protein
VENLFLAGAPPQGPLPACRLAAGVIRSCTGWGNILRADAPGNTPDGLRGN